METRRQDRDILSHQFRGQQDVIQAEKITYKIDCRVQLADHCT